MSLTSTNTKQLDNLRKKAFALCNELEIGTEARHTINFSINGVKSFKETSKGQFRNLVTFLQGELRNKQTPENESEFLASF